MPNRILTTHVGSLPRPSALLEANKQRAAGKIDDEAFLKILRDSIDEVVKRQHALGIDILNEGEYAHITSGAVDYGAWWNYSFGRLGGLTMTNEDRWQTAEIKRSTPGHIQLTAFRDRRDRVKFNDAYEDPNTGILTGRAKVANPKITGPITYIGQKEIRNDIDLLKAALKKVGHQTAFIPALSPGSAARLKNEHYATEDEVVFACADAMGQEYKAITDAGFTVQIDDPSLAESWDQINPEPSIKDYQAFIRVRIDAINHALEKYGIPRKQTRLHVCWGSWHGPHTTDVPFADIVDEVLRAKVGGWSFEGSSPRHAHEWRVWQDHKLPDGAVIYPGVVSHCVNAIEHPRLIADRLVRFAELVGPEHVVASTDCGLGGRLHPQIAWAKLEALVEGARLASKELF